MSGLSCIIPQGWAKEVFHEAKCRAGKIMDLGGRVVLSRIASLIWPSPFAWDKALVI